LPPDRLPGVSAVTPSLPVEDLASLSRVERLLSSVLPISLTLAVQTLLAGRPNRGRPPRGQPWDRAAGCCRRRRRPTHPRPHTSPGAAEVQCIAPALSCWYRTQILIFVTPRCAGGGPGCGPSQLPPATMVQSALAGSTAWSRWLASCKTARLAVASAAATPAAPAAAAAAAAAVPPALTMLATAAVGRPWMETKWISIGSWV